MYTYVYIYIYIYIYMCSGPAGGLQYSIVYCKRKAFIPFGVGLTAIFAAACVAFKVRAVDYVWARMHVCNVCMYVGR